MNAHKHTRDCGRIGVSEQVAVGVVRKQHDVVPRKRETQETPHANTLRAHHMAAVSEHNEGSLVRLR